MSLNKGGFWKTSRPHMLLVLTTFIWAGNAVMGKFAVGHISPMVLTFSRWLLAFILVSFIARKYIARDWSLIRANWVYLLAMGVVGYTTFNVLLYSALHYTTAINVAIEQSAIPMIIFLGNLVIYRLKFGLTQIAGFFLTILGVALAITNGDLSRLAGQDLNRGDLMMLFSSIAYAAYSIALKKKPDMHWLSLLAVLIAGATISSAIAMVWEINAGLAVYPTTTTGVIAIIYTGIFASVVAQASYIEGVGKLGANAAGIYINLLPVFTAIMAVLLLNERLGIHHAAALLLVIAGITLVQRQPGKKASA